MLSTFSVFSHFVFYSLFIFCINKWHLGSIFLSFFCIFTLFVFFCLLHFTLFCFFVLKAGAQCFFLFLYFLHSLHVFACFPFLSFCLFVLFYFSVSQKMSELWSI